MSREEAIKLLRKLRKTIDRNNAYGEAEEMAIQALEQEPCEDAIRRQAVLDEAFEVDTKEYGRIDVVGVDAIDALPPVTPQPKTGHWVAIDEEPHEVWECDHCGFEIDGSGCIDPYDYLDTYKFCPNCGAKMVGDGNER